MLLARELTEQVIGLAIEVHRVTGPGLLEPLYESCLCHELAQAGIGVRPLDVRLRRQREFPLIGENVINRSTLESQSPVGLFPASTPVSGKIGPTAAIPRASHQGYRPQVSPANGYRRLNSLLTCSDFGVGGDWRSLDARAADDRLACQSRVVANGTNRQHRAKRSAECGL
jgi:hypothetical protein